MTRCVIGLIGTLLLITAFFLPASAKTWLISPDGNGDCPHIKAAVDSSADGDTLLLSPGIFNGPDNREIDFSGKDIVLTSQGGASQTIIDCEAGGRGFMIVSGETADAEISHITITNAQWGWGSAIYVEGASPTIRHNMFIANNGSRGAAINVKGGSPAIEQNMFDNNYASEWGGAIYLDQTGQTLISDNTFTNNNGFFGGGAIYAVLQNPDIFDNYFYNNLGISGTIYLTVSFGSIEGNSLVENPAGGIHMAAADPLIYENIIAFNNRAMNCQSQSNPISDCNLVYGNTNGDLICGTDMGENLNEDPQFCGTPGSANFLLQSDSPCLPGSNNCGVRIGVFDLGCSTTPTVPATWGRIKAIYQTD